MCAAIGVSQNASSGSWAGGQEQLLPPGRGAAGAGGAAGAAGGRASPGAVCARSAVQARGQGRLA